MMMKNFSRQNAKASKGNYVENKGNNDNDQLQCELENILALRIDEDYIVSVTGVKDVSRIEYISLQIDTTVQSLLELPELLPNVKHLVLDNSTIGSVRDLGVGLRHLTSLSLSGCGLHDIDGVGVLTGLQELNLSDNYISDLSPLTMHEYLQVDYSLDFLFFSHYSAFRT
jgi:Leucine-rich repeat (LRR) protein